MIRVAIKFGLFVALCTTFLLMLAIAIGNTTFGGLVGRGPDTYSLTAHFDDATGLLVGDNVKVSGVPVGKVTGVSTEEGKAKVEVEIRSSHPLPADSSIALRWRNLIGQRYVYLYPGNAPVMFEDGATVEDTTSVIDLGQLFNELGPIVAAVDERQVNEFLDTITQALEGNEASISRTLDDLAFLVQGLGDRDEAIGRLIENVEIVARTLADRDTQIETMLDNLAALSQTFSDNTALLQTALSEIGQFNGNLSALLEANRVEIDGIIAKLDTTLNTVESELGPLGRSLAGLDDQAAATFRTSSYGTFLNEDIRCAGVSGVVDDPCALGEGSPFENLGLVPESSGESVPLSKHHASGGDAILRILGGDR